jgi:uncharacterized protein YjbI with pentapeptide repeats
MTESPSSRPLVRPRVISAISGESLLLEDVLEPHLQRGDPGAICIFGGPGAGKSSALRHLAARLPKGLIVEFMDDPDPAHVTAFSDRMPVVYSAIEALEIPHLAKFRLADWGQDECLEYLLAAHRGHCASVMRRICAAGCRDLPESPELWTISLDQMAADESIADFDAALRRHLDSRLPFRFRRQARAISYRRIAWPDAKGPDEVTLWGHAGFLGLLLGRGLSREDIRLLRHPRVRMLLAAERLAGVGEKDIFRGGLRLRLPVELILKTAALIAGRRDSLASLESYLRDQVMAQPMGTSLLHATRSGWRPPDSGRITWFWGAHLAGADWPALRLSCAQFAKANLSGATLSESTLDQAEFTGACLRGAKLRGSSLTFIGAKGADLSRADLNHVRAENADFSNSILQGTQFESAFLQGARFMGCDLRGAKLCRADLKRAVFQAGLESREKWWREPYKKSMQMAYEKLKEKGYLKIPDTPVHEPARLEEADFTGANLESAQLVGLDLRHCVLSGSRFFDANLAASNLEGVQVPGGHFEGARLYGALLTGSVMPGASFRSASLFGAKLADVEWEKADLRHADLRKASFHMGSSRSGLLFGEPSEGTRSGFYTDEYYDQSYRAPEEIRTANLRGADLRDALVEGTDFYLVDLREALFTSEQEAWFRRCGAILEMRV